MEDINRITGNVIGAAIEVHKALGPGLLESPYEACLAAEFDARRIGFRRQKEIPLVYGDVRIDCAYRVDFLVENKVVVELKAVKALDDVHTAQVLTYLKLGGYPVGLLINFNVKYLGEGAIRRLVSGYKGPLPRVP